MSANRIALILFFFCLWGASKAQNWTLKKNENGIQVFVAQTDLGINKFRAETTIDASTDAFVALLKDTKSAPLWFDQLTRLELVDQTSDLFWHTRSVVDLPWPMENRDHVASLEIKKIYNGILIEMNSAPDKFPIQSAYIRIKVAKGYWKLETQEGSETKVTYEFLSDPEGLPKWLVNFFLVDNPFNSLTEMKKMLKKEKYQKAYLPYLH